MNIEEEAKRLVLQRISFASRKDQKRAINMARQLATQAFKAAGIVLVDGCSVHKDSVLIDLTYDSEQWKGRQ